MIYHILLTWIIVVSIVAMFLVRCLWRMSPVAQTGTHGEISLN